MHRPCVILMTITAFLVSLAEASTAVEVHSTIKIATHSFTGSHENPTTRFLRIQTYPNNGDDEERAISAPSIELVQGWLKKGMISDDVAGLLTLGNAADDLLTGSLLNAWVSYIKLFNKENPGEKMSMIATLTARFGDEALTTMIEAAKKLPKSALIAKQVQTEQIQQWMEAGKSPDDVFVLLQLNKKGARLVAQPQLNTWVKYMDDFNKVNTGAQKTTIGTMRKYYTDDVLAGIIATSGKTSSTADTAKRLETELMREWFNSMKSPTDILRLLDLHKAGLKASQSPLYPLWKNYVDLFNKVDPKFKMDMLEGWLKKGMITEDTFRLLTLGNAADDLLTGSLLNAWVSYIKLFNKENPGEKMSMIATLTARFGDEALATMIEAAKKLPKSALIAKQVQTEQIQQWMEAGKSPDDVFVLLQLNKKGARLVAQPQLNTWVKYMDDFNKVNTGAQKTTIGTMRKYYTDDVLAGIIATSGKTSSTADTAKRLETELMREWFNSMKSPTDILRLLDLHKAGLKASQSPLYPLWKNYVDLFNKVDPKFKMDMLEGWLKKGMITEDTFRLLTLGNAADDLLTGSLLNAWVSYIKLFNKENPGEKMSMIATLTARFGDEALATMIEAAKKLPKSALIAKRVQAEQIQHWLVAGKIPDDVFVLLKLNKEGTRLFAQLQLNTWVKYLDEFNKANPASKTTLLSALSSRYNEADLVKMIVAAQKLPSTKSIAARLQAELTRVWLSADREPAVIFKLLKLDNAGYTPVNNPLFGAWVKYTDDFRKFNPGTHLTMIGTLRRYFKDEALTKMIQSSRIAGLSKRLEAELLREWYVAATPPLEVFRLLNLQSTNLKVLESPLFTVWTNYVTFFNKAEPTLKVNLLSTLTKVYGDSYLSNVLIAAEKVPNTKNAATTLQKEQFGLWLAAKRDPRHVYFLWHVDKAAAKASNTLLYGDYVTAYAKRYGISS